VTLSVAKIAQMATLPAAQTAEMATLLVAQTAEITSEVIEIPGGEITEEEDSLIIGGVLTLDQMLVRITEEEVEEDSLIIGGATILTTEVLT
jgi:hypothetical protein